MLRKIQYLCNELKSMRSRKVLLCFVVVCVFTIGADAGCNRGSKTTLLQKYNNRVSFGKEITWKDYATLTAALVADAYGCGSACTDKVLSDLLARLTITLREQVKTIGINAILPLILNGGSIVTGNARIDAGILTFQCTIKENKCCSYNCGQRVLGVNIPCTGCSGPRCGYTSRPDINKQLPYIAIMLFKDSTSTPTLDSTPTPTPTPEPTPTPTSTSDSTPTLEPTPTQTPTPTPDSTPTLEPTPTPTPTPTPDFTPTFTPTLDSTPTSTPTPDSTPTSTPTLDSTPTSTPTPDSTPTSTPTLDSTPTSTPTPDFTSTSTPTPDSTPTSTPTFDSTPTSTPTPDSTPVTTSTVDSVPAPVQSSAIRYEMSTFSMFLLVLLVCF